VVRALTGHDPLNARAPCLLGDLADHLPCLHQDGLVLD
jgi:hypothetical protein